MTVKTITAANGTMPLARPLKTLVELIERDLAIMLDIDREEALSMRERIEERNHQFRIAVGEKLIEAKTVGKTTKEIPHGTFQQWVKTTFKLAYPTAAEYMQMAKAKQNYGTPEFSSRRDLRKKTKPRSKTAAESRAKAKTTRARNRARFEDFMKRVDFGAFQRSVETKSEEHKLIVQLAADIVEAGFKALAMKLHPDKGGETIVMQRLNEAHDLLKGCLQ